MQIDRNIRAFNPWPVAFIPLDEQNNLRVWGSLLSVENAEGQTAGTVLAMNKQGVHVACGDQKAICLTSLQWPGGKPLNPVQINQTQKLTVGQTL